MNILVNFTRKILVVNIQPEFLVGAISTRRFLCVKKARQIASCKNSFKYNAREIFEKKNLENWPGRQIQAPGIQYDNRH